MPGYTFACNVTRLFAPRRNGGCGSRGGRLWILAGIGLGNAMRTGDLVRFRLGTYRTRRYPLALVVRRRRWELLGLLALQSTSDDKTSDDSRNSNRKVTHRRNTVSPTAVPRRAALSAVEAMELASVLRRLGGGRSIVTWIVSGSVNIMRLQKWASRII